MIGDERMLGAQSRKIIRSAREENKLAISAISFWEIALLVAMIGWNCAARLRSCARIIDSGVVELSVTGDIATGAVELWKSSADLADRFIAATALAHDAMLMTADSRLLRWRHSVRRQNAHR